MATYGNIWKHGATVSMLNSLWLQNNRVIGIESQKTADGNSHKICEGRDGENGASIHDMKSSACQLDCQDQSSVVKVVNS